MDLHNPRLNSVLIWIAFNAIILCDCFSNNDKQTWDKNTTKKKIKNKTHKQHRNLPQNGMPSGVHCPLSQTRRDGPSSSKPRSHVYVAIVPLSIESSENSTVLWAGEPGKLHECAANEKESIKRKKKNQTVKQLESSSQQTILGLHVLI